LSFLFGELGTMVERIDAAAECGFNAVEYMFPYAEDVGALRARLQQRKMKQALFNLPAGDFANGERGIAVDPRRVAEFRAGVADAIRIAGELGCPRINCLIGKTLPDVDAATTRATLVDNLRYAADAFKPAGLTLLIEPLNRIETPGFAIGTSSEALELIAEVQQPNFKLQYDCYHAQRAEGNLIATLQAHIEKIGHVQIADSPGRNQPGTGELAYDRILRSLDAFGYPDWVGLEYKPSNRTRESFSWIEAYGFERMAVEVR
jgi:hydroxypyruvate isomerase